MFGSKNKRNYVPSIFLLTIIGLFVVSIILIISLPKQYEEYTVEYSNQLKDEIKEVLDSDNLDSKMIELQNEYSFDVMLFDEETLEYTSNDLLYDVDFANDVYKSGYVYKGSYIEGDYLIWLVVYESDLSGFVNTALMRNLILFVLQALLMIVLLNVLLRKTVKPLTKLVEIIRILRSDNNTIESNEKLDEISEELVKVSNDLKLRLYYSKKEEKEYERMFVKQENLLLEQKNHLANVVHDVKGTFSAINFSTHCIANVKALDETEQLALQSIQTSSTAALDYITTSLNDVIHNSYDIYVKKDKIKLRKTIEEFFEFNNMLLLEKSLKIDITGNELELDVNILKFNNIVGNVLSNMIKYSKEGSTLVIDIREDKCTFINKIGNVDKTYSNSFGLKSIDEASKELGFEYDMKFDEEDAVFTFYVGDDVNA